MDDGPQTYFKIPLAKRRTEVLAQEAKDSSRARESGNVGGATSRSFLRDNNTRSAFEVWIATGPFCQTYVGLLKADVQRKQKSRKLKNCIWI